MKKFKPADIIQDIQYFGEYGGVNPSIADSSTFTYLAGKTMEMVFGGEREGCYLYSRHMNPSTGYLAEAISNMENTEAAQVTASGMGAITSVLLQICGAEDHIVSSRTIYGGTYAFMKNFLPKLNISTSFVNTTNLEIQDALLELSKNNSGGADVDAGTSSIEVHGSYDGTQMFGIGATAKAWSSALQNHEQRFRANGLSKFPRCAPTRPGKYQGPDYRELAQAGDQSALRLLCAERFQSKVEHPD